MKGAFESLQKDWLVLVETKDSAFCYLAAPSARRPPASVLHFIYKWRYMWCHDKNLSFCWRFNRTKGSRYRLTLLGQSRMKLGGVLICLSLPRSTTAFLDVQDVINKLILRRNWINFFWISNHICSTLDTRSCLKRRNTCDGW